MPCRRAPGSGHTNVVRLDEGRRSDPRVAAALSIIESRKGRVDIDRLAELAGMSI